jgi:hypothetical protein
MAWQHILYKHVVMTAGRLKDCSPSTSLLILRFNLCKGLQNLSNLSQKYDQHTDIYATNPIIFKIRLARLIILISW